MFFHLRSSEKLRPNLTLHKLSDVADEKQQRKWVNTAPEWTESKWGYIRKLGVAVRREKIASMADSFYIVTYANQPVGMFALLDPENRPDLLQPLTAKNLMYFYVDENFRSLGFGSAMLKLVKQYCKDQGIDLIELDTLTPNLNHFYMKQEAEVMGDGDCFGFPTTRLNIKL